MNRVDSNNKYQNMSITRHREDCIGFAVVALIGLGVTLGYLFHQHKSYDFVGIWLPGSISILGLFGAIYNGHVVYQICKNLDRKRAVLQSEAAKEPAKVEESIKEVGPQKLIVASLQIKHDDHSKKLYTALNQSVLEFLDFRDGLHWLQTTKERCHQNDLWTCLSKKLGHEKNDPLQPRQYIQRFGSETASLRQYFPNKDLLGFGPKSITTDLMRIMGNIPVVNEIEMMSKFLLKWANQTAEKIVVQNTANIRQRQFIYGAEKGCINFMKLMLAHNAQIDIEAQGGDNALIAATKSGQRDSVLFLLDNGASVEGADKDGWTALHVAVIYEQDLIVEQLLNRGADIHHITKKGNKVIHNVKTVTAMTMLVKKGASLLEKNSGGFTAIYVYGVAKLNALHDAALNLLLKQS